MAFPDAPGMRRGNGEGLIGLQFQWGEMGTGGGGGAYWPSFEYFDILLKTLAVNTACANVCDVCMYVCVCVCVCV